MARGRDSKRKPKEQGRAMGPQRRLLREGEAAEYLGTTPGALRADRHAPGMAIPFVKLGRAVRYDLAELERLIEQRTVRPESAAAGGA